MTNKKLSTNFWLSELIASNTATRYNIDNNPNSVIEQHLQESCDNLWQPTRDILGKPMLISSGYRSPRLNALVKGSSTSAHMQGYAIDFTCPAVGLPSQIVKVICKVFKEKGIKFDQVILEYPDNKNGGWVHLGYKNHKGLQRGQMLIKKHGTGYIPSDFTK